MRYLYIIRNILNNKVYIGQTKNPEKRWKQHKSSCRNKPVQYIHRAMAKYGIENFVYEIIAQSINQENADIIEIELIIQYDSRNPDAGYNFRAGGHVSERSEETKKRISEALKGKPSPRKGVLLSEEQKTQMSIIAKKLGFMPPNNKGKKLSEEHKQKLSVIKKGKPGKPLSEETKMKLSEAHTGKVLTIETKTKISESHKREKAYNYIQWTEVQIIAIKYDTRSLKAIAIDYNVSPSTIFKVKKGFYD